MLETAVAVFIYNRIETARRVLERIAEAQPRRLFVIADGPRTFVPGDAERCEQVRLLFSRPAWDCELLRNWSDVNLGAGRRVASGIDWTFGHCEEAILLEDDCVPDPTLFPFCAELLARYREDGRIFMISGDNYQSGVQRGRASYYFSSAVGTHGWATWRRAWRHFDFSMRAWPGELRETSMLLDVWGVPSAAQFWQDIFDRTSRGELDAWDYQWACAMWSQRGLQVVPNVNLVTNIGCGPDATNTRSPEAPFCNIPTTPMRFPLVHPGHMVRDLEADQYELRTIFDPSPRDAAAGRA